MNAKMREEIEAAYIEEMVRQHGEGFRSSAAHSIKMESPMVEIALWAWQASRAALVVDLPSVGPEPEAPEDAIDDSYMDGHRAAIRMRNACFKAIDAAGLKAKP